MPIRLDRPYFQPHPSNAFRRGDSQPEGRDLGALELGEHWTTQGILSQARFLAEYSQDPKRQGAWLLGLAACTANDTTTHEDLERALSRGLSLEEAARIAVFANSGQAAIALHQLGVDWSNQEIIPPQSHFANETGVMSQPNQALIEHFMEPSRAAGRYRVHTQPRLAIEMALQVARQNFGTDMSFLEGALQAGLSASSSFTTHALGLRSGKARLLSVCIANRSWDIVRDALLGPLDQDTLDEAFLACAMSYGMVHGDEDREMVEQLARELLDKGANRDRPYAFGQEAAEMVSGESGFHVEVQTATARQWFVRSALVVDGIDMSLVSDLICPLPVPKLQGIDWGQWGMLAYDQGGFVGRPENTAQRALITYLLDADQVPVEKFDQIFGFALHNAALNGNSELLDACLDCKMFQSLHGRATTKQFSDLLIQQINAPSPEELPEAAIKSALANRLWRHPRLDRLTDILPHEDAARFKENLGPFVQALEACFPIAKPRGLSMSDMAAPPPLQPKASRETLESARLAFTDLMGAFEAGVSPKPRPRRSL